MLGGKGLGWDVVGGIDLDERPLISSYSDLLYLWQA